MDIINILIILILSQFDPYLSRMPTYTPSLLHVKNWTTADTKCQWKYDTWCRKCYKLWLRQFEDKMPTCVMKHTEFRKTIKWWAFPCTDLIIHSTIAYISCKHVNVATLNFFFLQFIAVIWQKYTCNACTYIYTGNALCLKDLINNCW